jgi:hypothetical protein
LQDGQSQQVSLKAAAFNVKGIIGLELNQDDAAKQNFEEAIKLFPDFVLAKGNLGIIEERKKKSADTKPATVTPPAEPSKKGK